MPTVSARLEIHQVNVGQGDCTLVLHRNLETLGQNILTAIGGLTSAQAQGAPDYFGISGSGLPQRNGEDIERIDYMPWALAFNQWAAEQKLGKSVQLYGTVENALLVDGGNECYDADLRNHLVNVGVINPKVGVVNPKTGVVNPESVYQKNLSVLVTHYHDDHQDGLRAMMVDRRADGTLAEVFRPATFYMLQGTYGFPGDHIHGQIASLLGDLDKQPFKKKILPQTDVVIIPAGGRDKSGRPFTIELASKAANDGIPINVIVAASNEQVFGFTRTKKVPRREVRKEGRKVKVLNQNDRSTVLVVEYGSFRHFIGGDAGGGTKGSTSADVEKMLGPAMKSLLPATAPQPLNQQQSFSLVPFNPPPTQGKDGRFKTAGHCCSMKINHHGSQYANDEHFLATLQPRLAVIPAGVKFFPHGHPTKETVDRLIKATWDPDGVANTLKYKLDDYNIFTTEIAENIKKQVKNKTWKVVRLPSDDGNKVSIWGTIFVRPIDEAVFGLKNASGTGQQQLQIQVFGELEFSDLVDKEIKLKPGPVPNKDIYRAGPQIVICDAH